ncbi:MAG: hypothetical protein RIQ61_1625 [Bacteroidota bacterium]|jgi:hypothetical protein
MEQINHKIELLTRLKDYMLSNDEDWLSIQSLAINKNSWFTQEHISGAIASIANNYLVKEDLIAWCAQYKLSASNKVLGIVMAGNIPLVGFHDFLCGFLAGYQLKIKLSSKDAILLPHLIAKLIHWDAALKSTIEIAEQLKDCDLYIATGSDNSARYFETYFSKYPSIIRKNRTSVAVLSGHETDEAIALLAKDVFQYYGLGCRNVTQLLVPKDYNFEPLLKAFNAYTYVMNHHKYKNNYDYHLAIYLLNKVPYMSNDCLLMVENDLPFSAVSVLHYKYYNTQQEVENYLHNNESIQCAVGNNLIPFGDAQNPSLHEYADGVDTMAFLTANY